MIRQRFKLHVLLLVLLCGCSGISRAPDELYRMLGETPGITGIVDAFLYRIGDDPRIIGFFDDTDLERFHAKLVEQICALSGGPCVYSGDDMTEVHRGMDISEAHFNALVEDLILAMEERQVPVAAQNRLLALLAPMHREIMDAN